MSNLLLFNRHEWTTRQLNALREVGTLALTIATERYGSGFPDYRGGKVKKLGFNNARHNRKVGDNAAYLCSYLGFSKRDQELARTVGYAHDIRQLTGRGNDEAESAEWIEKQLLQTGVVDSQMAELAGLAIRGTLPLLQNGQVIGQTANLFNFMSRAEELFVKAIASADLGEVYMPTSPYLAHMLYCQQMGCQADEEAPLGQLLNFQDKQIAFLKVYRYPLPEAKRLFATHAREVMEYVQHVSDQLRRGEIETWAQLLEQDISFMNGYGASKLHSQVEHGIVA